jgi:hypothetical protein
MVKKPAIQILTAGRQQDEAQERAGHGVFTDVLVRGLSGDAFVPEKSWLALEELGLWVKQRVFAESNKKQLPQYGNLSGEGQFVFRKAGPTVGALAVTGKVAGVEVWLGDRKLGETTRGGTLLAPDLPAGTYQLKARKPGHKDWTRTVDVGANERVELIWVRGAATRQRSGRGRRRDGVIPPATSGWEHAGSLGRPGILQSQGRL